MAVVKLSLQTIRRDNEVVADGVQGPETRFLVERAECKDQCAGASPDASALLQDNHARGACLHEGAAKIDEGNTKWGLH